MMISIYFDIFFISSLSLVLITKNHFLLPFFAIIATIPVIISAIRALIKKEISVDLLASIALIFSFLTFEWSSAAFINLMISSARLFDSWTQKKRDSIIKSLLKFRPEKIKVKIGDEYIIKNLNDIKVGDILLVEEGSRIPVDGEIISGVCEIDESTLTGEAIPIKKAIGQLVFSPTLNISGSILIKATKIANESTLAKIITMVEESSMKKSKTVKTANKFAKWYVISTLVASIFLYIFTKNLNTVLAVLLVVCADDIAVSIPLAFTVAVTYAAKKGILIKSSDILEKISSIKIFITDKTGTLTYGTPMVEKIILFSKIKETEFLKYLGIAEMGSNHPIGKAIVDYIASQKIELENSLNHKEIPGEGTEVIFNSDKYISGKLSLLIKNKVKITKQQMDDIKILNEKAKSQIFLAKNKTLLGVVVFSDKVKSSAVDLVAKTKKLGVTDWYMLTGDNLKIAQETAEKVGIKNVYAGLNPEQKLKTVEDIKNNNLDRTIAMIGDGVNDAGSLARSDVSFAMGAIGSDTAIDASDVALMNDNLDKIPQAMEIGKKTKQIVYQNFILWGITNAIGLTLVGTGVLNATNAATYNFLTDFIPIFNALRVGFNNKK